MSLPAVICLSCNVKDNVSCSRIVFENEDSSILLLEATLLLINSCSIKQLEEIPKNLSENLVVHLKGMWEKVHTFMLCDTWSCLGDNFVSNIRANDMAQSIFRLCMDDYQCGEHPNVKQIKESIFDLGKMNFEQFIFDYWEASPLLLRGTSKASLPEDYIFRSLAKAFQSREMPSFIPPMLENLTSCPPIASDKLDIFHFLEEVGDHIGCPIIYDQDIRVVKTHHSKGELHYFVQKFSSCSSQDPHILHVNEIRKCKEAYNDGYTIALRGMEFRFKNIATIADGLASLFGQPSAGVNMYLTPPDSQGLSRHSDDHCVFVCQLSGTKEWKIFPRSRVHLPRLYESKYSPEVENEPLGGSEHFLLKEGDVLYIPRGFPHEARTTMDEDGSGFSLHLTLAIEIEPPFEWEGFVHVALNHWRRKHREFHQPSNGSTSLNMHVMSVNLLHVAVMLIGEIDPTFRKACLIGQTSLSTVTERSIALNQRGIFQHLISRINDESKFADLEYLEMAVQKHENLFQRLQWLQHLSKEGEMLESQESSIFAVDRSYVLQFCSLHKHTLKGAFLEVKSKFCEEIVVEDVEQEYKMLLDRYKKVRRQYTEGMLSLHLTSD
ncbi:OLC1v1035082C1 [Oldenlandia corymbosa var. corymbosa]|uniref:Bifunctional lysine-specific demethylase and histidyl-hydroxylase n=1 Tax=Oldenlandia corymbosa var. corymbosa TaxID=529605 RepID=A0AAV1CUR9_OLDCO|nr:OLC1v1035082C1 [Oldenlandia corymbosa var. corymbosa]